MENISSSHFGGRALAGCAAQVRPIDIAAHFFATNGAAGFALDSDAELFPWHPTVSDVPQELFCRPAAFSEQLPLFNGDREVKGFNVHEEKLHQTVYIRKQNSFPTRGIHRQESECCNAGMKPDAAEIRRTVLAALVERDSLARVAERMKKPASQIKDMISTPPRKSFGEKVARAMEANYRATWDASAPHRFLEDPNWLSGEQAVAEPDDFARQVELVIEQHTGYGPQVTDAEAALLRDLRELLPDRQAHYADQIRLEANVARAYKAMGHPPAVSDDRVAQFIGPAPAVPPVERRRSAATHYGSDGRVIPSQKKNDGRAKQ